MLSPFIIFWLKTIWHMIVDPVQVLETRILLLDRMRIKGGIFLSFITEIQENCCSEFINDCMPYIFTLLISCCGLYTVNVCTKTVVLMKRSHNYLRKKTTVSGAEEAYIESLGAQL